MAGPQPEERSRAATHPPYTMRAALCAHQAPCVSRAQKAAFTAEHGDTCANVCMQTRTAKRNRRSFEHCSIFLE